MSEQYVVELSGLPYFRGISSSPAAFLFLIFLRTESSSSCVNGPSLMSNCLLIILVIGSCVIFGGFPSKFSKCCFNSFILSCWFAALSFALAVFFLLLTSFIVCQAILDCLSSTESLILSIWFWMYSVCSFIYMPANWYCAVVLYFNLRPGQKCHSKVMHRKEVTYSNGSYGRKSRGRKLADEMGRGKKIPMVHS